MIVWANCTVDTGVMLLLDGNKNTGDNVVHIPEVNWVLGVSFSRDLCESDRVDNMIPTKYLDRSYLAGLSNKKVTFDGRMNQQIALFIHIILTYRER